MVEPAAAASPGAILSTGKAAPNPACADIFGITQTDPLVNPSMEDCFPSAHRHIVAGANGLDANFSFAEQLASATNFVVKDVHSAGWWPVWSYDGVETGLNLCSDKGCNAAARSKGAAFYYRRKVASGIEVQPFPAGFAMILRDGAMVNGQRVNRGPNTGQGDEIGFKCGPGDGIITALPPAKCTYNLLSDEYVFPNCWNGWELMAADGISHMSYPVNNRCPAAYPVPLLRVQQFRRSIVPQYQSGAATLDPAKFTLGGHAITEPGTAHADYRPAFEDDIMELFLRECVNWKNASGVIVGRDCGTNPALLVNASE